ncbi:hypothetical protein SAMN04489726_0608 [Allokutzneria albata]|uniref:Uncharacterized protein n=1 Tax=Allokutzneria albata TaxID=211114 RepID=A0A1G9RS69_ALLAB|nr:hypothetical protein SAMN04489726_0608 [Allokutzneria albata]
MALLVAPATATASSTKCGVYVDHDYPQPDGPQLMYNHCGDTNVTITVDRIRGENFEKCVPPGITHIGQWPLYHNAWYVRNRC